MVSVNDGLCKAAFKFDAACWRAAETRCALLRPAPPLDLFLLSFALEDNRTLPALRCTEMELGDAEMFVDEEEGGSTHFGSATSEATSLGGSSRFSCGASSADIDYEATGKKKYKVMVPECQGSSINQLSRIFFFSPSTPAVNGSLFRPFRSYNKGL